MSAECYLRARTFVSPAEQGAPANARGDDDRQALWQRRETLDQPLWHVPATHRTNDDASVAEMPRITQKRIEQGTLLAERQPEQRQG